MLITRNLTVQFIHFSIGGYVRLNEQLLLLLKVIRDHIECEQAFNDDCGFKSLTVLTTDKWIDHGVKYDWNNWIRNGDQLIHSSHNTKPKTNPSIVFQPQKILNYKLI